MWKTLYGAPQAIDLYITSIAGGRLGTLTSDSEGDGGSESHARQVSAGRARVALLNQASKANE